MHLFPSPNDRWMKPLRVQKLLQQTGGFNIDTVLNYLQGKCEYENI